MGWPSASDGKGQRPSVIMRGTCDAAGHSINPPSVYLVVFKEIVFYGGGVQYQQTCENGGGAIGWWDFFNTVLEGELNRPCHPTLPQPRHSTHEALPIVSLRYHHTSDTTPNLSQPLPLRCSTFSQTRV